MEDQEWGAALLDSMMVMATASPLPSSVGRLEENAPSTVSQIDVREGLSLTAWDTSLSARQEARMGTPRPGWVPGRKWKYCDPDWEDMEGVNCSWSDYAGICALMIP